MDWSAAQYEPVSYTKWTGRQRSMDLTAAQNEPDIRQDDRMGRLYRPSGAMRTSRGKAASMYVDLQMSARASTAAA